MKSNFGKKINIRKRQSHGGHMMFLILLNESEKKKQKLAQKIEKHPQHLAMVSVASLAGAKYRSG